MHQLNELEKRDRQRYVAAQAPVLLASLLSGVCSSGKLVNPKENAAAAIRSAEELYDQLFWPTSSTSENSSTCMGTTETSDSTEGVSEAS